MNHDDLITLLKTAGEANHSWAWGEGLHVGTPPQQPGTRTGAQMADPAIADVVVREHAAARGMRPGREAASLVFQRYCHRWCGIAVWAWAVGGVVLDVTAGRAATTFEGGSPVAVWLDDARALDGGEADVVAALLDGHLLPVARTLREVTGFSSSNAEGNIAAAIAGGFRVVARRRDPDAVRECAQKLVAQRMCLAASGTYRVVEHEGRAGLFYDRVTCCHWDAVPDGHLCTWCSKRTHADRTDQFRRMLAEL